MSEAYWVLYVIESKARRQRKFRPAFRAIFWSRRAAKEKLKELQAKYPHISYRVQDYWDKRPW